MSVRDEAARLVELCEQASPDVWLDLLRAAQEELAIAVHARGLVIDVGCSRRCHVRFAISPLGRVIHPLSGNDPTDLRLDGTAEDVAAFLLGEHTLAYAQTHGLVSIRPGAPAERLEHVRAVVAAQLRSLLADRPIIVPIAALAWRLRRFFALPTEWTAAAVSKVAPAVFAGVVAWGSAPATALPATLTTRDPRSVAVAPSPLPPPAPSVVANRPHIAHHVGQVAPAPPSVPTTTPLVTWDRQVSVADPTPAGEHHTNVPVWGDYACDNWYRQVVCDAAETLPATGS